MQTAGEDRNVQDMVAKVEDHVARNPNDGKAWEVLAPVYMRLGRYDDAVRAWRNVISLNGSNAEREADFGEAMVVAANGVVTADAKAAFDRALKIDPQDVMARFYMGMAADQDGRRAEADKIWNDLIAGAPPNAPWIEVVRHALGAQCAGRGGDRAGGGGARRPPDHEVNAMVERLAERLKKDGSDVNGWLQLVRSYRVLNQNDKMQTALADARKALASDAGQAPPVQRRRRSSGFACASGPRAAGRRWGRTHRGRNSGGGQADAGAAGPIDRWHGAAAGRPAEEGRFRRQWLAAIGALLPGARAAGQMEVAIADARKALASDPDKLKQFNAGVDAATSVAAAAPPPAPMAPQAPAAPPGVAAGPTPAEIAAAAQMKPDQQNEMIRSMVARLADKLKADGSDVAGWERLLRAYMVLGERDKAHAAATDARKALASDPDKLRRLDEVIKDLKVEG